MTRRSPPKSPPKRKRPGRPPRHETGAEDKFPGARVIKRYGNRRLYDGQRSRSVTMQDIADLVRKGEDVRVVDGDTGEDLTRRVLTQILLEVENARTLEMLPVELLRRLISLREGPMARWTEQYLSAGARFLEQQMAMATPNARAAKGPASDLFNWMKPESWLPVEVVETARPAAPAPRPSDEKLRDDKLRSEMAELERRLADLSAKMGRR